MIRPQQGQNTLQHLHVTLRSSDNNRNNTHIRQTAVWSFLVGFFTAYSMFLLNPFSTMVVQQHQDEQSLLESHVLSSLLLGNPSFTTRKMQEMEDKRKNEKKERPVVAATIVPTVIGTTRKMQKMEDDMKEKDSLIVTRTANKTVKHVSSTATFTFPTFLEAAILTKTDKVQGTKNLPKCLENESNCARAGAVNVGCRVMGHFYDSLYQKWLGPMQDEAFQFLEIGFYHGGGFAAFQQFLPWADHQTMEISCLPSGPRDEGKWPWGNFAADSKQYRTLLANGQLHCNDASQFEHLEYVYRQMRTPVTHPNGTTTPRLPLKVVVEDASHLSHHMAITILYWFPRIDPGGLLFVEDIESWTPANKFRQQFLPRLLSDLHYCGLEQSVVREDEPYTNSSKKSSWRQQQRLNSQQWDFCFPTITPFLKSISCELHICVLERNDHPIREFDKPHTMPPEGFLDKDGNLCWQQQPVRKRATTLSTLDKKENTKPIRTKAIRENDNRK
ncbi:hypothetical protein ACA910_003639 [Epithemia clementina (nom. ined.)]